jgi:hypothetical protein
LALLAAIRLLTTGALPKVLRIVVTLLMVELRLGMGFKREASPMMVTMSIGCFGRSGGSVNMIGLKLSGKGNCLLEKFIAGILVEQTSTVR